MIPPVVASERGTAQTIRHEGLNIYIYANPKNQRERDFNAAMSEKAEAIRCRRFEAIVNRSEEHTAGTPVTP